MESTRRAWLAFASGANPHEVAKTCVGQLDGMVAAANFGLIFMAGPVGDMADEVIKILTDSLGIERWFGACGEGIIAGPMDMGSEGGLAILCLALPADGIELQRATALTKDRIRADLETPGSVQTIWLHAASEHDQGSQLADLGPMDVGGICGGPSDAPLVLDHPVAGGAIGLRCCSGLRLMAGMSRGTRDLGPWRRITSSVGGCIMELDGRPATQLVEADTGELLARQPDRLIRQVIVETSTSDEPSILMPRLALIERFERATGRLHIRDRRPGNRMRLVYRQGGPAKRELSELARALLQGAQGKSVLAALLFSSDMRGEKLFGPSHQEPEALHAELAGVPLIGLRTSDEIYQGGLTCGAAVLVLIVAEETDA